MTDLWANDAKFPSYCRLFLLWAAILLFYLLTLAPTVLWGDSAYFQRAALEGTLKSDGGGHWLWLQFAQFFAALPIGTVAFRVNLLSAVAAVVTLIFLSRAMRALGLDWTSTIAACASLAVSHTFWMHAVRAEVYTVFTAMLALQLWLWLSWGPERPWPAYSAAGLFGLTLLAHQMAVLLVPAAVVLLWKQRAWFRKKDWLVLLGLLLAGLALFVVVLFWQTKSDHPFTSLRLYFTVADVDFGQALFDFSLRRLPRDAVMWLGLLGLQFVGAGGLLAIFGLYGGTVKLTRWVFLLVLYATSVAFAFSYRVNDQFVFYLPSYVAFSFFIARGWQRLQSLPVQRPHIARTTLLLSAVILPLTVYWVLPRLPAVSHLDLLDIRTLPGREPSRYFLWPASNGDYGAEMYAKTALETVASNSVIIADHTPLEPLRYLQSVEGVRQDVELIKIEAGEDLAAIVRGLGPERVIYLADNNPDYYNIASLGEVCVEPVGEIYQLAMDPPSGLCR